jgi:hypothetical protein
VKTEVDAQRAPISSRILQYALCENPRPPYSFGAVDQMTRDVGVAIDRDRIEMLIQKHADFGERLIQLRLLRRRDSRIRHRPIRHKAPEKKPLGETERLRPREEKLLGFLDFLLPLNFHFVHNFNPESL